MVEGETEFDFRPSKCGGEISDSQERRGCFRARWKHSTITRRTKLRISRFAASREQRKRGSRELSRGTDQLRDVGIFIRSLCYSRGTSIDQTKLSTVRISTNQAFAAGNPHPGLDESTASFIVTITAAGSLAPNSAVPATITFEPVRIVKINSTIRDDYTPARAQHPTVPGPTPPST